MEDLHAKLERLSLDAEDCELIAKLETDLKKRAMFAKLAVQLRTMARDVEARIMVKSQRLRVPAAERPVALPPLDGSVSC
jgi:hypothetical protein